VDGQSAISGLIDVVKLTVQFIPDSEIYKVRNFEICQASGIFWRELVIFWNIKISITNKHEATRFVTPEARRQRPKSEQP